MDNDVVKELDLRLVRGEIGRDEYLAIKRTITGNDDGSKNTVSLLARAKGLFSGPDQIPDPTDEHPLVVDDLALFKAHLSYKGGQHGYTEIEGLFFKAHSLSINLVPVSHSTWFSIHLRGGRTIDLKFDTSFIRGKKAKLAQSAYVFLQRVTFRQRCDAYLRMLANPGYVDIGGVRLFANGDVDNGKLRLNLQWAREHNALLVGTAGGWVMNREFNPDQVIVGEKGVSVFSKRIIFELGYNKDALKAVLFWLSGLTNTPPADGSAAEAAAIRQSKTNASPGQSAHSDCDAFSSHGSE
jgi:hypothetical protein